MLIALCFSKDFYYHFWNGWYEASVWVTVLVARSGYRGWLLNLIPYLTCRRFAFEMLRLVWGSDPWSEYELYLQRRGVKP